MAIQIKSSASGTGLRHLVAPKPAFLNLAKLVAMRNPRNPFSLANIAIALALAIIGVVGYRYSPLLLQKADLTVEPTSGCDLNTQACHADLPGGGRVELSITPHPIPLVKPLKVSATLSGVAAHKLEIDFAGVSMNMGVNRKTLQAEGKGPYTGDAMLPVCVTGRMAWRATLVVETERQRIAIPFLFEAPAEGK